jgi:hypothetical protein
VRPYRVALGRLFGLFWPEAAFDLVGGTGGGIGGKEVCGNMEPFHE